MNYSVDCSFKTQHFGQLFFKFNKRYIICNERKPHFSVMEKLEKPLNKYYPWNMYFEIQMIIYKQLTISYTNCIFEKFLLFRIIQSFFIHTFLFPCILSLFVLFFQLKSILRFCLVMFDINILYIYTFYMCARRRDITMARINIYTHIHMPSHKTRLRFSY